jgi:hypothetical protein
MLGSVPYRLNKLNGLGVVVNYPPRMLIREPGRDPVYVMGVDGQRHWITNRDLFDGLMLFLDDVKTVPGEVMRAIPAGFNIDTAQKFFDLFPKNLLHEQYLKPMTMAEIDAYIKHAFFEYPDGTPRKRCANSDGSKMSINEHASCLHRMFALTHIEKANLLYANNFINYDQLMQYYKEAEKLIGDIPTFHGGLSLKQQLIDSGKLLLSAVAGLVTLGPIGIFIGAASAVGATMAEARAKYKTLSTQILQPYQAIINSAKTEQEQQIINKNVQASIKAAAPWVIGSVVAGGLLLLFGDEIKKFTNQKN